MAENSIIIQGAYALLGRHSSSLFDLLLCHSKGYVKEFLCFTVPCFDSPEECPVLVWCPLIIFPFISTLNDPGSNIIHNWSNLWYFNCHHWTLSGISTFSILFLPIIFNMLPLVTRTELFLGNPPSILGPTNLLVTNEIGQKWWNVTSESKLQRDCYLPLPLLSLWILTLGKASCHALRSFMKRHQGKELMSVSDSQCGSETYQLLHEWA